MGALLCHIIKCTLEYSVRAVWKHLRLLYTKCIKGATQPLTGSRSLSSWTCRACTWCAAAPESARMKQSAWGSCRSPGGRRWRSWSTPPALARRTQTCCRRPLRGVDRDGKWVSGMELGKKGSERVEEGKKNVNLGCLIRHSFDIIFLNIYWYI